MIKLSYGLSSERLFNMESRERKRLELLTKVDGCAKETKKLELSYQVENFNKLYESLRVNQAKKLELNGKVEEFYNKCHDNEGLFCEGVGVSGKATTDAAKPSSGARSWIDKPGKQQMVIVYHEATRAGAHIDVHIGHLSMVYRVKPELKEKLKFASNGRLTVDSRNAILDHIKSEVANKSRVPQNLDHSLDEARTSWLKGSPADKSYGAGKSRQVVDESTVNVYKTSNGGPVEFYGPSLNPDKGMYIYKLHPGDDKRAPILIWGNKATHPPKFEDRLHLKSIPPEDIAKLGDMHITAKYDGASAYISIGPKGTTVWSPRVSKKSGEQIEYTAKLGDIANVKSPEAITGMGELLFTREGKYLSAAATGGILNSHSLIPDGVKPEIRLYRIDRVGRKVTKDLPFAENRALQQKVVKLGPKHFKTVAVIGADEAKRRGFEGIVAVPKGKSVNAGHKVKWWTETHDWEITKVAFTTGPKGAHAGVVHLKSLESGKTYKLGPGQMGNSKLVAHMKENPDKYKGVVVKVHSHHGHEGRSSKVVAFHLDKGVAAPKIPGSSPK